eukprot:360838-Chlamydomonas_euryale.AAC.11
MQACMRLHAVRSCCPHPHGVDAIASIASRQIAHLALPWSGDGGFCCCIAGATRPCLPEECSGVPAAAVRARLAGVIPGIRPTPGFTMTHTTSSSPPRLEPAPPTDGGLTHRGESSVKSTTCAPKWCGQQQASDPLQPRRSAFVLSCQPSAGEAPRRAAPRRVGAMQLADMRAGAPADRPAETRGRVLSPLAQGVPGRDAPPPPALLPVPSPDRTGALPNACNRDRRAAADCPAPASGAITRVRESNGKARVSFPAPRAARGSTAARGRARRPGCPTQEARG